MLGAHILPEEPSPPAAWSSDLRDRLYLREAQYRLAKRPQPEKDPEAARIEATAVVAYTMIDLYQTLLALPEFAGGKGLLPLQDLTQALGDLIGGGQPSLLTRRAGVGKGGDTFGRRYIKKQAVTGVRCLRALGYDEKAACELVAREFSAAGVKGRKRRQDGSYAVDRGTILNWVISAPSNQEEHRQISAFVAGWVADTEEPMTERDVIAWIKRVALSPEVQSKI